MGVQKRGIIFIVFYLLKLSGGASTFSALKWKFNPAVVVMCLYAGSESLNLITADDILYCGKIRYWMDGNFVYGFNPVISKEVTRMATKYLPLYAFGKVVKGFGRGSKELGIPTANLSEKTIDSLPPQLPPGIYYGLASVDSGTVHKMVLSVGWNPFYQNEKKSMETHILHSFDDDFYGSLLRVVILDYIRPEENYSSQDELIKAIKSDINVAHTRLEDPVYKHYFNHEFWNARLKEEGGAHIRKFSPPSPSNDTHNGIMNGERG